MNAIIIVKIICTDMHCTNGEEVCPQLTVRNNSLHDLYHCSQLNECLGVIHDEGKLHLPVRCNACKKSARPDFIVNINRQYEANMQAKRSELSIEGEPVMGIKEV